MTDAEQLTLAFDHRPAMSDQDFLVAEGNRSAVQWVDNWPDWPAPALVIHGPAGSGKSHLLQVFQRKANAKIIEHTALNSEALGSFDPAAAYAIDHADQVVDENAMLHLYNILASGGGSVLLAARTPVRDWRLKLADLASRLSAAPRAEIGAPDDRLMEAVLVKLFSDRQLRVDANIIQYMLRRMERSLAMAGRLVAAVDAAALTARRDVTMPLVRDVLANYSPAEHNSDE